MQLRHRHGVALAVRVQHQQAGERRGGPGLAPGPPRRCCHRCPAMASSEIAGVSLPATLTMPSRPAWLRCGSRWAGASGATASTPAAGSASHSRRRGTPARRGRVRAGCGVGRGPAEMRGPLGAVGLRRRAAAGCAGRRPRTRGSCGSGRTAGSSGQLWSPATPMRFQQSSMDCVSGGRAWS